MGNPKSKKGIYGFIFKPVIRCINNKHTSAIYGKVYESNSTAVAGAQITVLQADTVVTTALTNAQGNYKVMGLHAGIYSMKVEKEGYTTVTIADLKVAQKYCVRKDIKLVKP
jgi:hypothetical protein